MHSRLARAIGAAAVVALAATASDGARAEEGGGGAPAVGRPGPTAAEFARLQAEVREQRQLIIQMMQSEQQRYDMVLRLLQGQSAGSAAVAPMLDADGVGDRALPPSAAAVPTSSSPASAPASSASSSGSSRSSASESVRRTGAIEGKVMVPGGEAGDVYVYVENVRGTTARGRTLEIKQENKQFSPRIAVVQTGTTVTFPNMDAVYHNVFSSSPGNSFDLGSYRAGDKARSVTLGRPGVVDVFCNMHQKMSASVLVVPSPLFAKVRADGTFRIDNVPVGARKLVAWSPRARGGQQRVDVAPGAPTPVSFQLEREESKVHSNKLGQPYGSYRD